MSASSACQVVAHRHRVSWQGFVVVWQEFLGALPYVCPSPSRHPPFCREMPVPPSGLHFFAGHSENGFFRGFRTQSRECSAGLAPLLSFPGGFRRCTSTGSVGGATRSRARTEGNLQSRVSLFRARPCNPPPRRGGSPFILFNGKDESRAVFFILFSGKHDAREEK